MKRATQKAGDAGFVVVVVGDPKNGKRRYVNVNGVYPTRAKANGERNKVKRSLKRAVDGIGWDYADVTVHVAAVITEEMEGEVNEDGSLITEEEQEES